LKRGVEEGAADVVEDRDLSPAPLVMEELETELPNEVLSFKES